MPTENRVLELVARVERGDFLGAFEEFYAEDIVMQENLSQPTVGKAANREREAAFVAAIREIHENRAESVVIDGDRVAINWKATYTFADGSKVRFDQVAFQRWRGDRIVSERFYYDPGSLEVGQAA